MTDRKKPGVAFWATVGQVGVLLYVASFGPATWICSRTESKKVPSIYLPFEYALNRPGRLCDAIVWLATIGMPPSGRVLLPQSNRRLILTIDRDPPSVTNWGVNRGID